MRYTNIEQLRQAINSLSSKGKPFFFAINFLQDEGYLVENPTEQEQVFFSFPNGKNKPFVASNTNPYRFKSFPGGIDAYAHQFYQLRGDMTKDEVSLVNLTQRTPVEVDLSLQDIFALSQSKYQLYIPNRFVCFSPESFIKISNRIISSFPMKGTIDASIPNAHQIILNDKKEVEELRVTANLVVDELSTVAKNVSIVRHGYIDSIETSQGKLLQVSSEVSGELNKGYENHLGDIILSLLPAASITGVPKRKAYSIINSVESGNRGYYCGVAGLFDGYNLDTAVLIRFIEEENGQLYFRSGGGITALSVCENEYEEMLKKVYLPF